MPTHISYIERPHNREYVTLPVEVTYEYERACPGYGSHPDYPERVDVWTVADVPVVDSEIVLTAGEVERITKEIFERIRKARIENKGE